MWVQAQHQSLRRSEVWVPIPGRSKETLGWGGCGEDGTASRCLGLTGNHCWELVLCPFQWLPIYAPDFRSMPFLLSPYTCPSSVFQDLELMAFLWIAWPLSSGCLLSQLGFILLACGVWEQSSLAFLPRPFPFPLSPSCRRDIFWSMVKKLHCPCYLHSIFSLCATDYSRLNQLHFESIHPHVIQQVFCARHSGNLQSQGCIWHIKPVSLQKLGSLMCLWFDARFINSYSFWVIPYLFAKELRPRF